MVKSISLVGSCLLLLSLNLALAEEKQESSESCDEAVTTVAMLECLKQRHETADQELNQVYKRLRMKLSKSRQVKLKKAQRAWIAFRDTTAEFAASEAAGGSLYPVVYRMTEAKMTENRVRELRQILKRMEY